MLHRTQRELDKFSLGGGKIGASIWFDKILSNQGIAKILIDLFPDRFGNLVRIYPKPFEQRRYDFTLDLVLENLLKAAKAEYEERWEQIPVYLTVPMMEAEWKQTAETKGKVSYAVVRYIIGGLKSADQIETLNGWIDRTNGKGDCFKMRDKTGIWEEILKKAEEEVLSRINVKGISAHQDALKNEALLVMHGEGNRELYKENNTNTREINISNPLLDQIDPLLNPLIDKINPLLDQVDQKDLENPLMASAATTRYSLIDRGCTMSKDLTKHLDEMIYSMKSTDELIAEVRERNLSKPRTFSTLLNGLEGIDLRESRSIIERNGKYTGLDQKNSDRLARINYVNRQHSWYWQKTYRLSRWEVVMVEDHREPLTHHQMQIPVKIPVGCKNLLPGGRTTGGRLYTRITNTAKDYRKSLLIDGLPTTRVDFKCNHISMLYALAGLDQPDGDLYGEASIRGAMKPVSLIVINSSSIEKAAKAIMLDSVDRFGKGMSMVEAKELISKFCETHSRIRQYFLSGVGIYLQAVEGEIALDICERMAYLGKPVVNIHDEFMVLEDDQIICAQIMVETVKKWLGYRPKLTVG